MEVMTVVSFCVKRSGVAWDRGWVYEVREEKIICGEYEVKHIRVDLPFWKKKDTLWQQEEQKSYLQMLPLPPQGGRVCYICDRETTLLYGFEPDTLSTEWGLYLLRYYKIDFDGLVVFEDREECASELALRFAPSTSYIGVVSARRWRLEETEDYILEEYGYQMEVADTFTKLHPKEGRLLIWTGDEMKGLTPLTLPQNSVWLDTSRRDAKARYARFTNKQICNVFNIEKFCTIMGVKVVL